ncbi:MAG: hypothetical protein RLY66_478 [Candidatus Parcubacteria bacterium]|jgi:hypothetical protein
MGVKFPRSQEIAYGTEMSAVQLLHEIQRSTAPEVLNRTFKNALLDHLEVSPKKGVVEIVIVSHKDLGIDGVATRGEVFRRASRRGLEPCTVEIAVFWCLLNYILEPDETVIIATKPLTTSRKHHRVLLAVREKIGDEKRTFGTKYTSPSTHYRPELSWVFMRRGPKK